MGSLYLQVFKQTEHYQCLHISDCINIDKFKFHLTENNVHYLKTWNICLLSLQELLPLLYNFISLLSQQMFKQLSNPMCMKMNGPIIFADFPLDDQLLTKCRVCQLGDVLDVTHSLVWLRGIIFVIYNTSNNSLTKWCKGVNYVSIEHFPTIYQ